MASTIYKPSSKKKRINNDFRRHSTMFDGIPELLVIPPKPDSNFLVPDAMKSPERRNSRFFPVPTHRGSRRSNREISQAGYRVASPVKRSTFQVAAKILSCKMVPLHLQSRQISSPLMSPRNYHFQKKTIITSKLIGQNLIETRPHFWDCLAKSKSTEGKVFGVTSRRMLR
jgi:hypothetical protein